MRLFLPTGLGVSLLGFAAACGGDKPPLFPEHEDIPANPTAVVAPEDPAGHVDSPSEAQPPSPPEKAPIAAEVVTPPPEEAPAPAQATATAAEPRPTTESLEVPPAIDAIVNAMDRWDSDRDLDVGRHPGELLAFLGFAPGMRVGEIFAGRGYTTELLARSVGSSGHGTGDAKTLHRIDEASVTREVLAAGFVSAGQADFLRNPQDTLDWNDSPSRAGDKRGTSDRFVLKFVRP